MGKLPESSGAQPLLEPPIYSLHESSHRLDGANQPFRLSGRILEQLQRLVCVAGQWWMCPEHSGFTRINLPQQITITVTNSATGVVSSPLSFVVIDPVDRALPVTGTASQLSFYASPSGTSNVAGVPLGKQPVVQLLDSNGNVVTNTLPYIQLSISGTSGASLTGCVGTPHPDGVYYSGCTINQAGTYTLTATDTALANPTVTTVSSFTVVAGPATQLAFTSASPGPGTAGAAIPNVVVQAEDAYGNVATTASGSVAMTIQGGTTFTSGTTTVALSNGVATFSNLVMNTSGAYTFVATPVSISGVTTAITSAVTINPAAASKARLHSGRSWTGLRGECDSQCGRPGGGPLWKLRDHGEWFGDHDHQEWESAEFLHLRYGNCRLERRCGHLLQPGGQHGGFVHLHCHTSRHHRGDGGSQFQRLHCRQGDSG